MASLEMGAYPFDSQPLMDLTEIEEKVGTPYGPVKVSIYGNRNEAGKIPIVTFHDIGLDSENNFQNFFQFGTVIELANQFCVYNINAPGQEMDAKPLPDNYIYPSMDGLAQIVENVVEHFGFKLLIGFGIGAGANVFMRYALNNPKKVLGLVLINACATKTGWIEWGYQKVNINYLKTSGMTAFTVDYLMWHHFGRYTSELNPDIVRQYRAYFQNHPNPRNLALFIESYLNRNEIVLHDPNSNPPHLLDTRVLQLIGSGSPFIEDTLYVNSKLDVTKSEWAKIRGSCGLVLDESPEYVTEMLLLFLQGFGFFVHLDVNEAIENLKKARYCQQQGGCGAPATFRVSEMEERNEHELAI